MHGSLPSEGALPWQAFLSIGDEAIDVGLTDRAVATRNGNNARVRLGAVILADSRWSIGGGRWKRAEELGFDHAWTYDHLAWRSLRDSPWMATIPTLTAAALTTSRIRLGTLVASPNFRHPVPFAKELMTLDDISDGRLTVGIGAGGVGWDATMLGGEPWTRRERTDRFVEFVEQTDLLLREEATSFRGRFYSADGARNLPGCLQQPRVPFAIAATGPGACTLAARYGQMWVTTGDATDTEPKTPRQGVRQIVRAQMERLDEVCAAHWQGSSPPWRAWCSPGRNSSRVSNRSNSCPKPSVPTARSGSPTTHVHWPSAQAPLCGRCGEVRRRRHPTRRPAPRGRVPDDDQ